MFPRAPASNRQNGRLGPDLGSLTPVAAILSTPARGSYPRNKLISPPHVVVPSVLKSASMKLSS